MTKNFCHAVAFNTAVVIVIALLLVCAPTVLADNNIDEMTVTSLQDEIHAEVVVSYQTESGEETIDFLIAQDNESAMAETIIAELTARAVIDNSYDTSEIEAEITFLSDIVVTVERKYNASDSSYSIIYTYADGREADYILWAINYYEAMKIIAKDLRFIPRDEDDLEEELADQVRLLRSFESSSRIPVNLSAKNLVFADIDDFSLLGIDKSGKVTFLITLDSGKESYARFDYKDELIFNEETVSDLLLEHFSDIGIDRISQRSFKKKLAKIDDLEEKMAEVNELGPCTQMELSDINEITVTYPVFADIARYQIRYKDNCQYIDTVVHKKTTPDLRKTELAFEIAKTMSFSIINLERNLYYRDLENLLIVQPHNLSGSFDGNSRSLPEDGEPEKQVENQQESDVSRAELIVLILELRAALQARGGVF